MDPVDRRDWEDFGMDPDGPDSRHSSDDIDLPLAALMKSLQEIAVDGLETLLNDLPMPEQGAALSKGWNFCQGSCGGKNSV